MNKPSITVRSSTGENDVRYAAAAYLLIEEASKSFDIAIRELSVLEKKILDRAAVLALTEDSQLVGFAFYSRWNDNFISHSGMVINNDFRGLGLGHRLKEELIAISYRDFPDATIFSLTSSPQVRALNSKVGFSKVSLELLTSDPRFWDGCKGCRNYSDFNEKKMGEKSPCGTRCCCEGFILAK